MQTAWSEKTEIRALTTDDIAQVAEIERQEPSAWNEVAIRSECVQKRGIRLVLVSSGRVVGWICCRFCGDEAELLKIVVRRSARRAGLASSLLARLVEELAGKNCSELFLEVRSKNAPAIQFYRKHGFAEAGIRKGYYRAPVDDAVLMKKKLVET